MKRRKLRIDCLEWTSPIAWHSGTLAAAKQAVLLGTRGIAFSTPVEDNEPEFTALEPAVTTALQLLIQRQKERLLNVNIPLNSKGVKWTRQSVRHYDGTIVPAKDPRGRDHFWFTVIPLEKAEQGTDRWAVENRVDLHYTSSAGSDRRISVECRPARRAAR